MKKKVLIALIALSVLSVSASRAEYASASSVYDSFVSITDKALMNGQTSTGSQACTPIDLTHKWHEVFTGQSNFTDPNETPINWTEPHRQEVSQSFMEDKAYHAVTNYYYQDSYANVWVSWTSDENAYAEFTSTPYNHVALRSSVGINVAMIQYGGANCEISVTSSSFAPNQLYIALTDGPDTHVLFSNFPVTYPDGYEGLMIPTATPQPQEYSNHVPDFYVSGADDWVATIHDQNFSTFDPVPFLCVNELTPILYYEIWTQILDVEALIDTGSINPTVPIVYQLPKASVKQDFRVVGWYDCGEIPELQFDESSFHDFTINGVGKLHIIGLETCVQDTFPYIDIASCTAGMNESLAILAMQDVDPANKNLKDVAGSNPNNCHEMGKLGDWVNNSDAQLCPAFSNDVRNTVTPFVMFAVAGMVFYWISRGSGVTID